MDNWLKADSSAITSLKNKLINYKKKNQRIPSMVDFMVILGIAFGITGFAHFGADIITPYIESNFPSLLSSSSILEECPPAPKVQST